ncbi:3-oxoacyl-reductase [Lophiostoma macrostomum CBS 122681]|uniref:3-oxoacyl-reductase n=1 Tax=Lophiostoma macrostomum CBS 122681 TaxID=1314788 RepID=A0A6A6SLE7_9PLEO|nr:3-oxoacyl-reductase [Lophiostoma macrostomum CBS 122681]
MIAFTTIGARAGSRHLARFLHQVGRRNLSSVNGKVYAISGAASGVGLETAKVLHGMGARLSITDNRKEALEASIKEIIESNPGKQSEILSTVTDVRSSDQVKNWITRTISEFGALDGAANVAGVLGSSVGVKDLSELSDEEWDFIISVNQKGMFYALREQIKGLDSLGEGPRSIVNVSSVAGLYGDMRNACYSASKHAVVGLTRSVAKEVGRKGIRVNAVAP